MYTDKLERAQLVTDVDKLRLLAQFSESIAWLARRLSERCTEAAFFKAGATKAEAKLHAVPSRISFSTLSLD